MTDSQHYRFKVVGEHTMHCSGCAGGVEMSLSMLNGVEEVEANHQAQTIDVRADPERASMEAMRQQLAVMGYEVEQQR